MTEFMPPSPEGPKEWGAFFESLQKFLEDREHDEHEIMNALRIAFGELASRSEDMLVDELQDELGALYGIGLEHGVDPSLLDEMMSDISPPQY